MQPHSHEGLSCTFSGKTARQKVIASADPAVFICNECVTSAQPAPGSQPASPKTTDRECSFCGRQLAVFSRADASICAECIELCREILAEAGGA